MPETIAVIAALPREVRGLVRGLQPVASLKAEGVLLYRRPEAVVVAAWAVVTRSGAASA